MMRAIKFTQYLRPNGRKRPIEIERPEDTAQKADYLVEKGCWFDIEELTTGMISATVEHEARNEDEDEDGWTLAHELGPNGPPIGAMIDTLIKTAVQSMLAEREKES